jgi:hypothetical protein
MKRAVCTWGDGPDVVLDLKDDMFVLYEKPELGELIAPFKGTYLHGYVTKGSMDLTADEALQLAAELTSAAQNAKEMDRMCQEHDKMEAKQVPNVPKLVGLPLSEIDLKAVLADYPLETLTCYKCSQRDTCKYVDDLYNTHGDCLAMK